ncbi:MAG: DUF2169 domain-containing protein [Gammaproteobacteria bacterium]
MRMVKPLKLSLLSRPYDYHGKHWLSAGVLMMWDLDDGSLRPDNELWKAVMEVIGRGVMLDAAMPKTRGEYLVFGSFHSPGGKAVEAGYVQVRLGRLEKRLNVYGDRYWGAVTPSKPQQMTTMPIDWEHAFGGSDYKPNPLGKGAQEIEIEGTKLRPLPNVEDPAAIIGAPNDKPSPAGFRPLDPMWPQRFDKVGTYDEKWLRERAPGLADDINLEYFNAASQDQWLNNFWTGDEAYEIKHMHPDRETIRGLLPQRKGRCFIQQQTDDGPRFRELDTHLDTVILFPEQLVGVLIWRGLTEIDTDDASDVSVIMAAYDELDKAPRSLAHYETALVNRLDKQKRLKYLLDESDLIPEGDTSGLQEMMDSATAQNERENLMRQNMESKVQQLRADAEQQLQAQREELQKAGLDADKYLPAKLPESEASPALEVDIKDPAETLAQARLLMDEMKEKAEQAKQEAETKARDLCKQAGVDYDKLVEDGRHQTALPRIEMKAHLEELKTAMAVSPEIKAQLRAQLGDDPIGTLQQRMLEAEQQFRKGYRMAAERVVGDALPPQRQEKLTILRERVMADIAAGKSLASQDLAGLPLAGAALRGADFRDCYLELADFTGADLTGANFSGAILAKAKFSGATLESVDFTDANLGKVDFTVANMRNAKLTGAVLNEAMFVKADLTGLVLEKGQFMHVDWSDARLEDARIGSVTFFECKFERCSFSRSEIGKSIFFKAEMGKLNVAGARLKETVFVETNLQALDAQRADMENVRFVKDVNLNQANFRDARVINSNLRNCLLEGADFSNAEIAGTDFSEAIMIGAKFQKASGARAKFMKTNLEHADLTHANLMEAMFDKARLVSADLQGANLYGSEFMGITVGETNFRSANLKMTKLKDWHP